MFKSKLPQQEQGFTLVEVLVAILVATIFVTITMQMMVIAAIFKVRSQEYSEATNWIQSDLENVKYQAATLQFPQSTTLTANANAGATLLSVASVSNLAVNDTLKIGLDSGNYQITKISGTTLSITPKLITTQVVNAAILKTTMCNATQDTGLADYLRDQVNTASTQVFNYVDYPKDFRTGKRFRMRKSTTLSSDSPYTVLKLSYDVSPTSGGSSIAKFYTEVIPNAAFQCP